MIRTCLARPSQRLFFTNSTPNKVLLAAMSSSVNASGLTTEQTKGLKERQPEAYEKDIIKALHEMYSCKPTATTFNIYAQDGIFHDPIGHAQGPDLIRDQFVGLAKILPRGDIQRFRVLEAPPPVPKTTLLIDQDIGYFRDPKADSPTKVVNSLLTIETNAEHKVTRHTEEWNHKKETTSDDGFLGMLNEQRKKLTASVTGAFVGGSK
ncbi:hypothetical protein BDV98DRAFT_564588 [Pterulicium gracile]|uniref:Uncharacterized protein n=1 Tax=Pterulicium gracile TaxID=1884261 RepID=A0A5C3QQK5_9AGAR|nr:hypothetical protein BDV98DRAFT_564588 [Pterula gracilis]